MWAAGREVTGRKQNTTTAKGVTADTLRSPPPCQISPPSVQRQGCRTPKIEIFTQI